MRIRVCEISFWQERNLTHRAVESGEEKVDTAAGATVEHRAAMPIELYRGLLSTFYFLRLHKNR